jgi:hypothetical protein
MGSITSRSEWPPKKPKKPVPQFERRLILVNGKWVSVEVQREDYVSQQWPVQRTGGNES